MSRKSDEEKLHDEQLLRTAAALIRARGGLLNYRTLAAEVGWTDPKTRKTAYRVRDKGGPPLVTPHPNQRGCRDRADGDGEQLTVEEIYRRAAEERANRKPQTIFLTK